MTVESHIDLLTALAQGALARLIGTAESDRLDFKQAPYPLDTDKGKYDLCSDVAALANTQGGLIVCGVKAKRQPQEILEAASALTPFPRSRVTIETYHHVLDEYVRPLIPVELEWFDHPQGDDEHSGSYFVIQVPPLPANQRYALVRRCITAEGHMREGVSIPLRNGDRTVHLPADDAYRLINDGLRMREHAHLGLSPFPTPKAPTDSDLDAELGRLEREQDWDQEPTLWWQSAPGSEASLLPRLYGPEGIEESLTDQDTLRGLSAFNFRTLETRPQVREGALAVGDRRCLLNVDTSGLVSAGAVATSNMLCWAMDSRGYPNRLNVLAITEMTLEYFRFADRFVLPHTHGPWRHRISARGFAGDAPRQLAQGGNPGHSAFGGSPRPASADHWVRGWEATGDPETDAFRALERLYALFGLPASANPYLDALAQRLDTKRLLEGLRTAARRDDAQGQRRRTGGPGLRCNLLCAQPTESPTSKPGCKRVWPLATTTLSTARQSFQCAVAAKARARQRQRRIEARHAFLQHPQGGAPLYSSAR